MEEIKIIVATHKEYDFPEKPYYIPIQVGKVISHNQLSIQGDNTGQNISSKNNSFCELTALYWAWQNHFWDDCRYAGLVHYRRYFSGREIILKDKYIASDRELLKFLQQYDCIVPKKRNYYIETVYDHYKHAHHLKDLECVKKIIIDDYPEYFSSFDKVMSGKTLHLFNMFVMQKELLYDYCSWVFDILFKLEKQIDIETYDTYQKRIFGFIAERLFNVWLVKKKLRLKEIKVISLEGEKIVSKAVGLLRRKFL